MAILVPISFLSLVAITLAHRHFLEEFLRFRNVLRLCDAFDACLAQFLLGITQHSLIGGVDLHVSSLGVVQRAADWRRFKQRPELLLAFAQHRFRPFALGNVLIGPFIVKHVPLGIPNLVPVYTDPKSAAILAIAFRFKSSHGALGLQQPLQLLPPSRYDVGLALDIRNT